MLEHSFYCPYCGEPISMLLDGSEQKAQYIEDCEVCCRPIQLDFAIDNNELVHFEAKTENDS